MCVMKSGCRLLSFRLVRVMYFARPNETFKILGVPNILITEPVYGR